jgi:diguanylate cyclase (GGDEF)-like protein
MSLRDRDTAVTLRHLAAAIDADHGAHLYLDRGDGIMRLAASVKEGRIVPSDHKGEIRVSPEQGILRRAFPSLAHPPGASLRMALPDSHGGLLVLERRRREPFSEEDVALARVQSRQLVPNAMTRLGHRGFAWSAQLEAVQSVAAQLTRLSTIEEVSSTLCAQAHRVLAFDNARVYVLGEDGATLEAAAFRPHAAEYEGEDAAALRVSVGEGITGWVAESGQAVIVHDAARHPRAIDVPGSVPLPEESMLLAPLRSEGRVIGVVVLSRIGLNRFTDDDLRLLRVLADQTGVAIENARLLAARDRHVSELAALLDISQASSRTADEAELASVLARTLAEATRVDACILSRADEATGALGFLAAWDRDPARLAPREAPLHRAARQVLLSDTPRLLDVERHQLEAGETARCAALGAVRTWLMPLATGGRVVGIAELVSRDGQRSVRADEMSLLRTMTNQTAAALENAHLVRQLRDAAETDLVTGVYSHRHLQDRMRQESARAARTRSPMAVLMLDLDGFKAVNDRFGHQSGDRVLRAIAGCLRASVRTSDVVARYGGDEFVVLMPDTTPEEGRLVAGRAGEAVAALVHPMADGNEVRVGCSIGLAHHPADGRSGKALLRAADAAMYAQKRARGGGRARRDSGASEPPTVLPPVRPTSSGRIAASPRDSAGTPRAVEPSVIEVSQPALPKR